MSSAPVNHHPSYPDFQTLFEDSLEIQYVLDVDQDFNLFFSAINKAFIKYTKMLPKDVVGKRIEEVFPNDVMNIRNAKLREAAILRKADEFTTSTQWSTQVMSQSLLVLPLIDVSGNCTHLHVKTTPLKRGDQSNPAKDLMAKFTEQIGFFSSLLDATELAIVGLSLDGTIHEFNRGAERLLGFDRYEVTNKYNILTFFIKSEIAALQKKLSTDYNEEIGSGLNTLTYLPRKFNQPSRNEWTFIRKDGTEFPIRLTITAVYDNLQKHSGYLCLGKDLTEDKRTQLELKSFFDITTDLMCIVTTEGKYISINKAFKKELGYSSEELFAGQVRQFMHPDDIPGMLIVLEQLAQGKTIFNYENRYRKKNGEYIWVSWQSTANLTEGLLYATGRNITQERYERELLQQTNQTLEKYQAALDRMALVSAFDTEGKLLFANQNYYQTLGYLPEELLGTNVELTFANTPGNENRRQQSLEAIIKDKVWRGETCNQAKDGSIFWVDNIAMVFENDAKWGRYIFIVGYDITERKVGETLRNQNTLLQKERDIAEHNTKMKEQFLSNMSHEIRTPLNAIIGTGNLLLKSSNLNEKQKQYLSILSLNAKNLLNLINDILDLSKIESGNIQLVQQPFNIQKQIETVINSVIFLAEAKEIELRLIQDHSILVPVVGDELRLCQILMNLLSNAIKFTPIHGEVSLAIEHIADTPTQITLRFTVNDNGIGIPLEKQKSIFEPFIQAEETTTRNFGGTGLGLNIVKKLVELHGSEIFLHSQINQGSEFSFVIAYLKDLTHDQTPLACAFPVSANHNTVAQTADKEATNSAKTNKINRSKILLVEDNPFNQLVFTDTITDNKPSMQIDLAENAEIAESLLQANHYDIIFLDLELPDRSGFQLAKIIRSQLKLQTPIIAMSAHDKQQEMAKVQEAGMNDYLSKPFEEADLLAKLDADYDTKSAQQNQF